MWFWYFIHGFLVLTLVQGYPMGAPTDTCMTLFPKHKGTQTQLDRDAYLVQINATTYLPGQRIQVTLTSPSRKQFKGVQVRARKTEINQDEIIGMYENLYPADKLHFLHCQGRQRNMVTHSNNVSVPEVRLSFVTPDVNVGPIVIEVTIVESFSVFYFGLKSPVIVPAANGPPVVLPAQIIPNVSPNVAAMDWGKCGESKGCLLYPRYCSGDDCKIGVSYVINKTSDTATFEMMVQGEEYISLGLSHDTTMGEDETISCSSVFDRVNIQHGWNHPHKYNVPELRTNLMNLEAARSQDGRVYCRFTRPVVISLVVSFDEFDPFTNTTLTFDLNKEHFMFVAWGHTYETSDILGYHYEMPVISETKVDFLDHSIYRGSVMPRLIRAHSTLMSVAWMGFAGLAIMMARYYKDGFHDKKICGIKIWFHIHRTAAIITFVLTAVGLIVVLVKMDGKITEKPSAWNHMCLGFTVVALVCSQILGGFIRPAPDSKIRPLFNFFHRLLGTAAIVIAAAALIYAYKIKDFTYEMQRFGERTVAVWAGVFVFFEILHFAYEYFMSRMCVRSGHRQEYKLDNQPYTEPANPPSPSHILLTIYLLFVAASIAAAFCMTLFF